MKKEKNEEEERKRKHDDHKNDLDIKVKEVRRANRDAHRALTERFEDKEKKVDEKLEAKKEERDKEVRMKREVRILKEEDMKKIGERQARQEKIKKMYIIEKEIEQEENIEKIKNERDKLIRENQDRHR